ncbi:MAG TPA: hypothetical protein VEA35_02740 [Ramlibacter sp.]|nr:hypothetical protein [Candidatus Limnocylindrales bacterium]HYF41345.1 hypothetical protein [Ramlibacter sp.]
MTAADRAMWRNAAHFWRQQEKARRREGRWRAAAAAAREAEAAEAKAAECDRQIAAALDAAAHSTAD